MLQLISNQGVNWAVIWADAGFLLCVIFVLCYIIGTAWAAKNWKMEVVKDYDQLLEKRNAHATNQAIQIEMLRHRNDEMSVTITKLKSQVRKRNSKGQFIAILLIICLSFSSCATYQPKKYKGHLKAKIEFMKRNAQCQSSQKRIQSR